MIAEPVTILPIAAQQLQFGKFLLPGVEQFDGIARRDGEQQFKIFAIGERGDDGRFGGGIFLGLRFGSA